MQSRDAGAKRVTDAISQLPRIIEIIFLIYQGNCVPIHPQRNHRARYSLLLFHR